MENLTSIQTEVDASFLYALLAEHEEDPNVAHVFREMSEIEAGHAAAFLSHKGYAISEMPKPSFRARFLHKLGGIIGYEFILGILLDTEKSISSAIANARKATDTQTSLSDTSHVEILKNILNNNTMRNFTHPFRDAPQATHVVESQESFPSTPQHRCAF
jgi:rubrerythrin